MKKKKFMAIVLSASLLLSMAGCSQKSESKKTASKETESGAVALTLWGSEEDQAVLQTMVDSFKEKYKEEAEFDITVAVQSESECKNVLLADVENGADVFTFADDQLQTLVAAGAIEPVNNPEEVTAANIETSITAATVNDTLYAYPMTADNGYFLYYNKKYLSDQDVATMDGILEVCEKEGKLISMDWSSGWYLYTFFGLTGLELTLNEDGITNTCTWNSTEGAMKGIDVAQGMVDIASSSGFRNQTDDLFLAGAQDDTVIAGVSGTWNASAIEKAWGDDYAAVKLPTYTCGGQQVQMASYAGYKMVGVNHYSDHGEWAMKLADWITNEENQSLRFTERGQGPSNNRVAESSEVAASPAIQAVLAQSEYASLQRVGGNYWDPATTFGMLMSKGKGAGNLQTALDKMVKGIQASTIGE